MYLKQLDIQGFKSFPEKAKLEFNMGITTVVGPNGSGKSNISDSIRWVLGEQRAKSLRGDKMEDVIFAGTSNRKPLGFAEVSITLDNEDKKIPLDYTDIKVTRIVYRSGESKYMINGTTCRLKDVHELFMDTGIGKEGYSIIGQGRIDEILSSKGEDRRRLFEEAAGIVKYRARRLEALNKLEKEEQHLIRVEDIISELEMKVEPLKNQAEIAKKYLALKETLKKYEINNFCVQVDKLEKNIGEIVNNIVIYKDNIEQGKKLYSELKKFSEENKEKEETFRKQLQILNDTIVKIIADLEKTDGEIKLCIQEINHIHNEVSRLNEEQSNKLKKIEELKNEDAVYSSKLTALDLSLDKLNFDLSKEEEAFNKLSGNLAKGEEEIEEYKTDMIEKVKNSTDISGNIQRLEALNSQFRQRYSSVKDEMYYIESQMEDSKTRVMALNKLVSDKKENEEKLKKQLNISVEKISATEANMAVKNKELQQKNYALNEFMSKRKVLSDMKNDYEGFYKSVKSILKLRGTQGFEGICGAVGEIISVDKEYETAIEIAIGQSMQNIITETEQDAKKAIEYLKRNFLGRGTFLPLKIIEGRDVGNEKNHISKAKGFVGIAKDLIKYDNKYEKIMASILGRVIVVENIDCAISLAKETKYKFKIVTIDGDVVNAGGTMTGGSAPKKTSGIFGRTREISELEDKIKVAQNEAEELKSKISSLEELISIHKENYEKFNQEIQKNNIEIATMNQEKIESEKTLKDKEERYLKGESEINVLSTQINSTKEDINKFSAEKTEIEAQIENINKYLEEYQGNIEVDKTQRERVLNKITEIKISLSSINQEKNSVLENKARVSKEQRYNQEEIKDLESKKDELFEKNNFQNTKKEDLEKTLLSLKDEEVKQVLEKENLETILLKTKEEINSTEQKSMETYESINKIENDLYRLETKLENANYEKDRLFTNIWDEYEITHSMAKEAFDETIQASEISSATREIKNDIKNLGNVNVNAIEEYKEVSERFEFLSVQRDDIKNAEEKLKKVIVDLTGLMEEQFKEQFEIINKNFSIVFKEMFGGGTAYLKMADENDVLESGIEIIAQPPGKTLQNMMLLSGGERALTAIAILFGILKMKPSPFCILDEIEAALDEANVKRFANYLKEFSDGTQFIIITHRKGTMEAADVMYGVTMQEQGVSKVISVKFDEAPV